MSDDTHGGAIRHVGESLAIAALVVGFVLGVTVIGAWTAGYPGFGDWWLLHVVLPTYITETALVAAFWARKDIRELVKNAC